MLIVADMVDVVDADWVSRRLSPFSILKFDVISCSFSPGSTSRINQSSYYSMKQPIEGEEGCNKVIMMMMMMLNVLVVMIFFLFC